MGLRPSWITANERGGCVTPGAAGGGRGGDQQHQPPSPSHQPTKRSKPTAAGPPPSWSMKRARRLQQVTCRHTQRPQRLESMPPRRPHNYPPPAHAPRATTRTQNTGHIQHTCSGDNQQHRQPSLGGRCGEGGRDTRADNLGTQHPKHRLAPRTAEIASSAITGVYVVHAGCMGLGHKRAGLWQCRL